MNTDPVCVGHMHTEMYNITINKYVLLSKPLQTVAGAFYGQWTQWSQEDTQNNQDDSCEFK